VPQIIPFPHGRLSLSCGGRRDEKNGRKEENEEETKEWGI